MVFKKLFKNLISLINSLCLRTYKNNGKARRILFSFQSCAISDFSRSSFLLIYRTLLFNYTRRVMSMRVILKHDAKVRTTYVHMSNTENRVICETMTKKRREK